MNMICASDAANIAAAANVKNDKQELDRAFSRIAESVSRRAKLGGDRVDVQLDKMALSPASLSSVMGALQRYGYTVSKRDDRFCPNHYLLTIKWDTYHDLQND